MNTLSKILIGVVLCLGVGLYFAIGSMIDAKTKVTSLETEVTELKDQAKKASEIRASFDKTIIEAKEKAEKLDTTYSTIRTQIEDLENSSKVKDGEVKTSANVTSTLAAAKRMLDDAACTANGDCKPSEIASKALQDGRRR